MTKAIYFAFSLMDSLLCSCDVVMRMYSSSNASRRFVPTFFVPENTYVITFYFSMFNDSTILEKIKQWRLYPFVSFCKVCVLLLFCFCFCVCVCVCQVRWGELLLYAIFTMFCLYMAVSFHSWRNKLFLGVNQQPSVSNWQLPFMGIEPQWRGRVVWKRDDLTTRPRRPSSQQRDPTVNSLQTQVLRKKQSSIKQVMKTDDVENLIQSQFPKPSTILCVCVCVCVCVVYVVFNNPSYHDGGCLGFKCCHHWCTVPQTRDTNSNPVTLSWHRGNQSQLYPINAERLAR